MSDSTTLEPSGAAPVLAFTPGTLVHALDRFGGKILTPVEDLRPGDNVTGADGAERIVKTAAPFYGKMLLVDFGATHPLKTIKGQQILAGDDSEETWLTLNPWPLSALTSTAPARPKISVASTHRRPDNFKLLPWWHEKFIEEVGMVSREHRTDYDTTGNIMASWDEPNLRVVFSSNFAWPLHDQNYTPAIIDNLLASGPDALWFTSSTIFLHRTTANRTHLLLRDLGFDATMHHHRNKIPTYEHHGTVLSYYTINLPEDHSDALSDLLDECHKAARRMKEPAVIPNPAPGDFADRTITGVHSIADETLLCGFTTSEDNTAVVEGHTFKAS